MGGPSLEALINEKKTITVPEYIFIIGLFAKQFYLLPSGSFQIGDLLLMTGCFMHLVFTKKGRISVDRSNNPLIAYVLLIAIINLLYFAFLHNQSFLKPIAYYFYNFIVVISFSSFLHMDNRFCFMEKIGRTLKASLIVQLGLLLSGLGRWAYATRYSGSFNDPNQYSVFIFFTFLMIFLIDKYTNKKKWIIWCVLGTALVLPSTSTGTMLGILVFWGGLYLSVVKSLNNHDKIVWGIVLLFFIIGFVLLSYGKLPLPRYITSNSMYIRIISKLNFFARSQDSSTLLADRGWTRVVASPQYFLIGAGEGGFERFNTWLEIHSSIIGPLFYYGIIPFALFARWMINRIKGAQYKFVFAALMSEAVFLVNTRQPMYWMLFVLIGFHNINSARRIVNG